MATSNDEDRDGDKPTLMERITAMLLREPEDREELTDILRGAFERHLLDADALSMIEGVLSVSETTVRDIMIPRSQMDCVSVDDAVPEFIPLVVETRHSRFPVIGESKDDVIGILLAKELLNYHANPEAFNLRDTLRPAVFVPESKRLNVLLRDFRANRNHIAIVVDEYGGVSGLVTIEDVLEQIVGDIDDEFDLDEQPLQLAVLDERHAVAPGSLRVDELNARLSIGLPLSDDYDTLGGLIFSTLGRLPETGEVLRLDNVQLTVRKVIDRRVDEVAIEILEPVG